MKLSDDDLDILFRKARTYPLYENKEVPDRLLSELYDTLKMAPTWANCQPGRFVFVKSPEAKQRLLPHVDKGNIKKVESAAVTAIIAEDPQFYENMPRLFPYGKTFEYLRDNPEVANRVMFQSTCLQAAYLITAARALGLDCGPMDGFNKDGVNKEFFSNGKFKSVLLCNLGYGDKTKLPARGDRLRFEEACQIL